MKKLIVASATIAVMLLVGSFLYAANPNDIIINEVIQNPAKVGDSNGEWFELYNTTGSAIDINGWEIRDKDYDSHVIDNGGSPLYVPAQGYLVLGNNADSGTNGGYTCDYEYPSNWYLSNSSDEIYLVDDTTIVDSIWYDNGATYPDPSGKSMELNWVDQDNDNGSNWHEAYTIFGDGDFGTPGAPNSGPVVINEIMQNPLAVSDANGEYFEIYNLTGVAIDINGWVIRDKDYDSHTIANGGPLNVPAGGYLTLGANNDPLTNGGYTCDYVIPGYPVFTLSNSSDEVIIQNGTWVVDSVAYDNGATFPDPNGASMELCDPTWDNTIGSNWWEAKTTYGDGDKGTPGSANSPCLLPVFHTIYEIQYTTDPSGDSPYEDSTLVTSGIVTAAPGIYSSSYYYIQDGSGAWNGIKVYDPGQSFAEGDSLTVTGSVDEYYGETEIDAIGVVVNSTGNPLPAVFDVTTGAVDTSEAYEGVLIKVSDVVVTDDDLGYGEWEIDDGSGPCRVGDGAFYSYSPVLGNCLHVTGIGSYNYGDYKIEPRYDVDIELLLFPPVVSVPDTTPTVNEGVALSFAVDGSDPRPGETVTLSALGLPPGATFTDGSGNPVSGSFDWTPNYGQAGVYAVTFIATDGGCSPTLADTLEVTITVNDVDQKPTITATYTYYQGMELYDIPTNTITAFDPDTLDKDDVSITVENLPDSAHFTLHQSNPAIGYLDWMPLWNQGDSTYTITFIAQGIHSKDLYDSVKVTIDVVDKVDEAFTLSIDSVAAWPCQHVDVPVSLCGSYPVGGYNVLIHWDCSMADLIGVEQKWYHVNGDSFKFEYFNWTTWEVDDGCKVRVVGLHDKPNDVDTPPIDPGQDQLVFDLFFEVSNTWDINYEIPITFEVDECGDNALSDPTGYVLYTPPDPGDAYGDTTCPLEPLPPGYPENPSVALIGGVIYHSDIAEEYVGDINLNETPYEIADAVMYLEYLNGEAELIPGREAEQSAASDVNLDGTPWCIADVVLLIDIINGYAEPLAKVAPSSEVVEVTIPEEATDHTQISVHSPTALGGAYFVIKHDGQIGAPILAGRAEGMNLDYNDRDGELRVIIYSWKSNQIDAGDGALFTVSGEGKISLRKVQFSNPYGSLMKVKTSTIPIAFKLAQNYPNPFNPVTTIAFDLPQNSDVTLTIYNIMGEKVETLVNSGLKAGHYEVNWNARSVSSGIYFYTINAGSFTDTKKMVLMK